MNRTIQYNTKYKKLGISAGLLLGLLILLYCGLGSQKEKNQSAMWILSLLSHPSNTTNTELSKESEIRIGDKEIQFDANREEEARITLTEYNTEGEEGSKGHLEFKVQLVGNGVEVKADIYNADIDKGARFFRRELDTGMELEKKELVNTIMVKEGGKEYIVSEECNGRGEIDAKGKELRIEVEECKIEDIETKEIKDFSAVIRLKAKEKVSEGMDVANEGKEIKSLYHRWNCNSGGGNEKILWLLLCYYKIIDYIEDWQLLGEVGFDSNGRCYELARVVNFCNGAFIRFDRYYASRKCWFW